MRDRATTNDRPPSLCALPESPLDEPAACASGRVDLGGANARAIARDSVSSSTPASSRLEGGD
jgi:hypothetical protein